MFVFVDVLTKHLLLVALLSRDHLARKNGKLVFSGTKLSHVEQEYGKCYRTYPSMNVHLYFTECKLEGM